MRVICWNIERGYKAAQVIRLLKQLDADIYLLSELDRGALRSQGVDMLKLIGDTLGLEGKFATEFFEVDKSGGKTGNAVFSRFPIKNYQHISLPAEKVSLHHPLDLLLKRRHGSRQAQTFSVTVKGKSLGIISTHLELLCSGWQHHKLQLEAALLALGETPAIVAGDFNNLDGAIGSALRGNRTINPEVQKVRRWLMAKGLIDPFTDSDTTAGRYGISAKIDWLAASDRLKVVRSDLIRTDASDHACLVVDYDV